MGSKPNQPRDVNPQLEKQNTNKETQKKHSQLLLFEILKQQ